MSSFQLALLAYGAVAFGLGVFVALRHAERKAEGIIGAVVPESAELAQALALLGEVEDMLHGFVRTWSGTGGMNWRAFQRLADKIRRFLANVGAGR